MKKLSLAYLFPALLLLTSCFHNGKGSGISLSYVETVLEDTSAVGYHVLRAHDTEDKYKSIAVVGSPEETLPVINEMMSADYFNNIDGRMIPDGLPDFSGEMIEGLLDVANSPYDGYVLNDNGNYLREINVRNFISALDTNYIYSPYDRNQLECKSGSKIVIFGSTYSSCYGMADVDTLRQFSKVDVPIFSPVDCMFDKVLARRNRAKHLCVWTTDEKVNTGLYPDAYGLYLKTRTVSGPELLVFNPDKYVGTQRRFMDILDLYLEYDFNEPISCMIVDDPGVNMEELELLVKNLKDDQDESKLAYRNVLADDFEFIYPARAIAESVFRFMREKNCFTHKISYPVFKGYMTYPVNDMPVNSYTDDGSFTADFKYHRADGTNEESWFVISMRERYISAVLRSMMEMYAPKIVNEYVYQ